MGIAVNIHLTQACVVIVHRIVVLLRREQRWGGGEQGAIKHLRIQVLG